MNIKRTLLSIVTGVTATALLAASVSAYDLDKDLKTGWSISTTVPGSEFENVTETSVITITYTADPSIADMPGHDYWVIKPMINDTGWPLVAGISQLQPSEDGSSYVVPVDGTEIKFTLPAADIEHIQIAGLAFMGHGITLGTLTVSNDEAVPPAYTPAEEAPAAGDVDAAADYDKTSPATGVTDVTAFAGLAVLAAGTAVAARKRK
ncbi:MAG: hypothetical protein ACI4KR_07205 [Ruminiclostridium sp.]